MRTVTFYSYKGGVGRTLALANIAWYLAYFGERVFVLDLDLEAPGLHYKLLPGRLHEIQRGVVDYLHEFLFAAEEPAPLAEHVLAVRKDRESGGEVYLMPAGRVPSSDYWRRLSQVNWHDLFYSSEPRGIPFFLELKAQIEDEYRPDFLLIDARTGVTEIGGVATTVLPEQLVCLLVNNQENLEGTRAVLRSLRHAPRLPNVPPVEVLPVLTRIPSELGVGVEEGLARQVREFLSAPADDLAETVRVEEIFVLHSEPGLQVQEHLKFGGAAAAETPLMRDYVRLFRRIAPRELLRNEDEPEPIDEGVIAPRSAYAKRISSRSPMHMVLVADDSASMKGEPARAATEAIQAWATELYVTTRGKKPYFRFSLISYGSAATIVAEALDVRDIDVKPFLLDGSSGTSNLASALAAVREILARDGATAQHCPPTVVVFTDGKPTDERATLAEAAALKAMPLPCGSPFVVTLGFGDASDTFLRQLASTPNHYHKLRDAQELVKLLPVIGTPTVEADGEEATVGGWVESIRSDAIRDV